MSTTGDDRRLLVEAADYVELQMVKGILAGEGIPCVVEGPDFDVAELGRAAHDMLRGQDVYVPASAYERAKAALDEAFGAPEPPEGA